ncbi:MAG: TRAP transporter substrate-binding protein DctP [Desulfopila sp.]
MRSLLIAIVTLLFGTSLCPGHALAATRHLFKVATLAPEGSVWVNQFTKFAQEVSDKTGGEVTFRIYPGGIMGDDQAMYRKMRAGQLQGGGFTMTGIAPVVPDFRIMSIPFTFTTYAEVDAVSRGLLPLFKQQFARQGLEFVAMTEVGFIYTMSTRPRATIADLETAKIWAPAGDPLAATFLGELGHSPIQLSIPDVLSSLSTGLIDTVFNSLYGSIVLQWFTKAKYVTDTPFGYAYGVFLLDGKKFARLPSRYATIVHETADTYFPALIDTTRRSNDESHQVLQQQGVAFVAADPVSLQELEKLRQKTVDATIGTAYSAEIYHKMMEILATQRKN